MAYRDSASYGKRQEFHAIAKLIELGYDVYSTLIDDQAIDCVIRRSSKRYLDIQVKATSIDKCDIKTRGYFPQLAIVNPRDNYFFILYSEGADSYWVIPSKEIIRMAEVGGFNVSKMKSGGSIGKYSIRVAGSQCNPLPQFEMYRNENGFKLLK